MAGRGDGGPEPRAAVHVVLLRRPRLVRADGTEHLLSAKDAALLAMLALEGALPRERVMARLWPDADATRAHGNLRQRLFRLRKAAGLDVVAPAGPLVLTGAVQTDLAEASDRLADDPESLPGDLLEGLAFEETDLAAWLDEGREAWRRRRRDALAAAAARHEAAQRWPEALRAAECWVREDPLAEDAVRLVMRLHYRRGDPGSAVDTWRHLLRGLRAAGRVPGPDTADLARLVQSATAGQAGRTAMAASPGSEAVQAALLHPPRLIGRAAAAALADEAWSRGRAVVVAGEPGIGKSRLIGEWAVARGLPLAGARPGDARVPFALLARLVRELARARTGPQAPSWEPWVRGELARVVPELGEAASGSLVASRLAAALEHAVAASAPRGLALDDLQFADDASLDLLAALPTAGCLLALRGHEAQPRLAAWIDGLLPERAVRCDLAPLTRDEVGELVVSLRLPGLDAEALAARLHLHCGGNPLFVLETLRHALARGGVGAGAGRAAGEGGGLAASLALPGDLRVLIERRLATLSAPAQQLAQVAALAGGAFGVELAAAVLGRPPLDLAPAWRELETAQVLEGEAFAHDVIFECVRDGLPGALRIWLHGAIAKALEAAEGGGGAGAARRGAAAHARLAHHWREAGEPARAARAYAAAAEAARAAGRLAEHVRWLDSAAEMHGRAGERPARFDVLARRAVSAREALTAPEALAAAETLLGEAADERERGIANFQIAACHMNAARFDLAMPAFAAAIAAASSAGDDQTANHARYVQAVGQAHVIGPQRALALLEPLAAWAESQGDASLAHSFIADLAIVCDQADQRRRARGLFQRALAYFDRQREVGNAAPTRTMLARSLVMLGELDRARELLEAALRDRAEASAGAGGHGLEALNLARVWLELGWYAEALGLLEPLVERLSGEADQVVRGAAQVVLARVHVQLGQAARAEGILKAVPPDLPYHQEAVRRWTASLLAPPRSARRLSMLGEALDLFSRHADLPFLRLPIQVEHLAACGGSAAISGLREAVAECERREMPAPQMAARARLVQVMLAEGQLTAAHAVALGVFDDLPNCRPVGIYLPELYAACRDSAIAADDAVLARRCQDAAVQWIALASHEHVPPAFKESFAQRNPVNRAILLATLGPPA